MSRSARGAKQGRIATGATKTGAFSSSQVTLGSAPSLALDAHDRPRIAFSRDDVVHYAMHTALGWQVSAAIAKGVPVELRLDGLDHPHVAYLHDGVG
jgi:hypothetical protein